MSDGTRRLTRSRDDRMLGGVCGGLANYTGIDPVVFRVVFAVAGVLGGAGVAAYVIAWLVLPDAGDESRHAESLLRDRNRPRFVRLALYVVAAVAILAVFDGPFGDRWGGGGSGLLVLAAVGIWLWSREGRTTPPPPIPPPPPVPPTASEPSTPSEPTRPLVASPASTVVTPVVEPPADRVPRARRERSKLTGLTISALLLAAGTMALLEVADVVDIDAGAAFAVCLLVVGAGLLVGAFYGRGPGLIPLGIVLTVLAAVANVADVPFRGGAGERDWRPTAISTLERDYHLGAGEAVLDLSRLDLDGTTRRITATVALGQLLVRLPPDVELSVDAHVGFGNMILLGREQNGIDVDRRIDESGDDGRLELDLRVGMGELEVTR